MLELDNIVKTYKTSSNLVQALRGVSVNFRESEFVAILGPSGCGKTTLLNIIGGLDRYTSGNLLVSGVSTNSFSDELWDAYRNSTIGFVFQSYNLIPHLTVSENVELALSLCGENKQKRKEMTLKALETVHMTDQANKKPSQLSGGQMQRVAIARALVNNPEIVLADEPTGALDSELSVEVMNILANIAKDKLVIMVTHNDELAKDYCNRIVKLRDGQVEYDTNPLAIEAAEALAQKEEAEAAVAEKEVEKEEEQEKKSVFYKLKSKRTLIKLKLDEKSSELLKKLKIQKKTKGTPFKSTSMTFGTAMSLSLKNLVTKKRRTFLTAFAGSIGIIGLGLVLSLANGFNVYIYDMQTSILASVPISIYEYNMDYSVMTDMFQNFQQGSHAGTFPTDGKVHIDKKTATGGVIGDMMGSIMNSVSQNNITKEFTQYLKDMNPDWTEAINYYYGVQMNILAKQLDDNGGTEYVNVSPKYVETSSMTIATTVLGSSGQEATNWNQLMDNPQFIEKYYDVLEGNFPTSKEQIALVVDANNTVQVSALKDFGIDVYQRNQSGALILNDKGKPIVRDDITFKSLIGEELKVVLNDDFYTVDGEGVYKQPKEDTLNSLYDNPNNIKLEISGVLRVKPTSEISIVGTNLCYTSALAEFLVDNAHNSRIAMAQQRLLDENSEISVFGKKLPEDKVLTDNPLQFVTNKLARTSFLKALGVIEAPTYINIYPTSFETKSNITGYIESWDNVSGAVGYFDISEMFIHNMRMMVDLMTYVLIVVTSISLIVSSIMIAVITGNSVVERTREIGILRSLGARKRDIMRVFNAETSIIGAFSGILGIAITYALVPLGSLIIEKLVQIPGIMSFNPLHALMLILLSLALTIISGLLPARSASKKNVVDALRAE